MILLLSFFMLIIIFIILIAIGIKKQWDDDGVGLCCVMAVVLFCIVAGLLIAIPVERKSDRIFIEKVKAVEITLNDARKNKREFEKATITKEIIEMNKRIVELKYNNEFWYWGWWIDDLVEKLELIK